MLCSCQSSVFLLFFFIFIRIFEVCYFITAFDIAIAAIMAERSHLFPFRTQKLSFLTPKVLCGTPLGRIGHRRFSVALLSLKQIEGNFFILYIKTAGVSMRPRFFVDKYTAGRSASMGANRNR